MAGPRKPDDEDQSRSVPELIDELEETLERLRALYEQYFLGIERMPPIRLQDRVPRLLSLLLTGKRMNTVQRFRVQGLKARFITFQQYWTRTLGQIERGTYRRDLNRAARKEAAEDPDRAAAGQARKDVSADEIRRVYEELQAARIANGETDRAVSYTALADKLQREIPKLEEHFGQPVRFEVKVVDGKVRLRARKV